MEAPEECSVEDETTAIVLQLTDEIFGDSFELCGVYQWISNLDGCGNGLGSYPILS